MHARIAGLMALMATADCYEKEDLAGKVIPSMSICLVDREKFVRLNFRSYRVGMGLTTSPDSERCEIKGTKLLKCL